MNTKETQQVMENNEQYMSLYSYRGQASKQSGLGREVNTAAKAKRIKIVYEQLPEALQTKEFTSVATYPVSFLDEYFGKEPAAGTPPNNLTELYQRLVNLEMQFNQLVKKLDTVIIEESYDDLPF